LITAGTFGAGAYTFPGALAITGAFTGATTGAFSGKITSTVGNNAIFFDSVSATTGYQSTQIKNTGAWMILGIEGSTASSLVTNDTAYSTVLVTQNATDLILGTNQTMNLKIASGGAATFSSTLAVTGQTTITTTGGVGAGPAAFNIAIPVTDSSFVYASQTLASALTTTHKVGHWIGRAESTNNSGYLAFHYIGAGSASNYMSIGMYAADDLLKITAGGAATFSGDVTVTGYLNGTQATTKGPYVGAGSTVTLTDGSTVLLTSAKAGAAIVTVYDTGSGNGGVFFVNYSGTVVKLAGDGDVTDTGSTFAVYKSASSHTCTLKNRYGITRSFNIGVYSAAAIN
jgi:hypothetical protein